jgi:hypothetical protein
MTKSAVQDHRAFTAEEITVAAKAVFRRLSDDLPEEAISRLRPQRIAQRHGTDTRVLMFHYYDRNQPQILDYHHFGYTLIYDPTLRYHPQRCVVRFYANRHRIYDKKEQVIPALWESMQDAERDLYDFRALQNEQMIGLFRMFDSESVDDFSEKCYQAFLELVPYWQPTYAAVVDTYGAQLSPEEVAAVIAGRRKFQPKSPKTSSRPEYSRHVPRKLRAAVFARDGFQCLSCGATDNLHADHIVAVANGGLTILDNLQTLCAAENLSKGARNNTDYRKNK